MRLSTERGSAELPGQSSWLCNSAHAAAALAPCPQQLRPAPHHLPHQHTFLRITTRPALLAVRPWSCSTRTQGPTQNLTRGDGTPSTRKVLALHCWHFFNNPLPGRFQPVKAVRGFHQPKCGWDRTSPARLHDLHDSTCLAAPNAALPAAEDGAALERAQLRHGGPIHTLSATHSSTAAV